MSCIINENFYSPIDLLKEGEEEDETFIELFTCKYCKYQTTNIDSLDEHIVSHDEAIFEDDLSETEDNTVHCPSSHLLDPTNSSNFNISPDINRHKNGNVKFSKQPANYSIMVHQKSAILSHKEVECKAKKTVSVCPYCRYISVDQLDMDKHLQTHCEPVEVPVYACSECSYTTIRKSDMTKHLLIHVKDGSGPKYECNHCSYTSIKKWCLQKHMLCHKQLDEVEMYSCTRCPYSTKRRSDLKKHSLTHENHPNVSKGDDSSNLTIYRCDQCPYESIKKWCLQKHMFRHKRPEEVKMYFCDRCTFFTNRRSSLKKHLLIHTKNFDLS